MLYWLYGYGYTLFSYPHLYFSTCNIINQKKTVQMRSREKERDLKRERPRWRPRAVVLGRRRGSDFAAVVEITCLILANLGFFHHHHESLHHSHTRFHQTKFTTSHHHHHHEFLHRTLNDSRLSSPSRPVTLPSRSSL
ncbi:hypothetical protein HanPSC8_Chr04g0146411 [Helianthus annuus]|nr:hypothetical protein HanPSC8_Chr04g0146411 [Helianthus annuus]